MTYTDKQQGDIIGGMVVLVDTREQKNDHILTYFKANNIAYRSEKLDTADYTFVLPDYPELNLDRKFLVERKGSINEIAGNLTKDRARFIREFERVDDETIHMVVEDATWKKIMNGSYRSQLHPNSFVASMLTLNIRYNCPMWFCTKDESGWIIYNILKYGLREYLRNLS